TTPSWADQHTTTPTVDTTARTDTAPTVDTLTPTPETTVDTETPINLDTIHNQHAENTPAGVSHHRGDPTMGDLPHRVPADPTRFTADTHITPDGQAQIGPHTLTPEQYGDLLRRSGWDGVTPIRLIGCDASSNGFADRLAQHLGVEVLAPTQAAWTDSNGNVFSTSAVTNADGTRSPRIPPDGQWQSHHPNGTVSPEGPSSAPPNSAPMRDIDAVGSVDRARPVPPRSDSPDRDSTPQQSVVWNPPSNDDGTPLPEVQMQVPPGTRVADLSGTDQLQPNSRVVVADTEGRPVGVFYTDADGNITHAEIEFSNRGHDRTVSAVGVDPNISRPAPGVTYLLRDHSGSYVHSYSGLDIPTSRVSGPEPAVRLDPNISPNGPRTERSPAQQFNQFRTGPIDPAVDWHPAGDQGGSYRNADPVTDYDPTALPFSLTGPRDPFTRYDVYDTNGDWHGSFYTGESGNFSHVHTRSGNQARGFNPELGTGATWDAGLPVPIPNATFAVGPRYLSQHGLDPRVPQQLFRTDEHGDSVAASFIPTYAPRGTSST
ncbi:hypothetical protein, partial [Nocardia sp. NPDC058497]|uniref:hypothetical protein n=1 Tax=Nocardia sp. NPDC058497 TaxID=3346529 RepID=UPI00364E36D4